MELAAKSGLGYPVEVIENYKALYDHFSDNRLGLQPMGITQSTEEVIIVPNQNISQSEIQTISFSNVQGGTFTITFPVGNNNTTSSLAYNTTYDVIQTALEAIPSVGNNIIVTGGPLPDQPVQVAFTGALANQDVPDLQITSSLTTTITGAIPVAIVEVSQVGTSADGENVILSPQNTFYMYDALSDIQPVTSIVTLGSGQGSTLRQPANAILSESTLTGVVRYVTGNRAVPWPTLDSTHWIQKGVEHEAPRAEGDINGSYQGFHNISNVIAYTENALLDSLYGTTLSPTSGGGSPQWPALDNDIHVGGFSNLQTALYPFLSPYTNPSAQFFATQSIAAQAEPLTITSVTGSNEMMINGIYPVDYQGLPGVPQPVQSSFWSSLERASGTDYLEIDLGTVQAVNLLYFEASNKPYTISVEYDLLDQSPARLFYPITLVPNATAISTTSLSYSATNTNPWTTVAIYFSNSLGNQIFTRYLRVGFTKVTANNSPFTDGFGNLLPYSIEVQNLRVGRNVA
jgi:hypothetical protein